MQRALEHALSRHSDVVDSASDVRQAARKIQQAHYDLLVLDVCLPDGSAFDLLDVMVALEPQPAVIAVSGAASVQQSFMLAQRGVRTYLEKPITADALDAAVNSSLDTAIDLRPHLRAAVGQRPIHEVEQEVRAIMVREALARARGNRSGAARLLSVSRQLLQHMIRTLSLADSFVRTEPGERPMSAP